MEEMEPRYRMRYRTNNEGKRSFADGGIDR
jgi:hypothetical protein